MKGCISIWKVAYLFERFAYPLEWLHIYLNGCISIWMVAYSLEWLHIYLKGLHIHWNDYISKDFVLYYLSPLLKFIFNVCMGWTDAHVKSIAPAGAFVKLHDFIANVESHWHFLKPGFSWIPEVYLYNSQAFKLMRKFPPLTS